MIEKEKSLEKVACARCVPNGLHEHSHFVRHLPERFYGAAFDFLHFFAVGAYAGACCGKRSDGEARGKANRLANFDDANMRRSAKAAAEASEKVQHAFEVLGDNIPDNLRQAGQLRIDHVDKSLEELGKIAEPQITKDAIAGRTRRLLQLAEKTEKARAAEGK